MSESENGKSKQATNMSLGIQARNIAVKALIDKYQTEYNTMLGDAREALGLPRVKPDASVEALRERVKKQQERLLKLQADLLKAEGAA